MSERRRGDIQTQIIEGVRLKIDVRARGSLQNSLFIMEENRDSIVSGWIICFYPSRIDG